MYYRKFEVFLTGFLTFFVTFNGLQANIETVNFSEDSPEHSLIPTFPQVTPEDRLNEANWISRFRNITKQVKSKKSEVVFLGDSITHGWKFTKIWNKEFGKYNAINAGISSDKVQNLLWRVQNGNFDKIQPKLAVILIGINNLAINTPYEIAGGIQQVTKEIHSRSPHTKILLLSVLPSGKESTNKRRQKIRTLNENIKLLANNKSVFYLDIGNNFLNRDGSISKAIMFDYLHLTQNGYKIFADSMKYKIESLLISH